VTAQVGLGYLSRIHPTPLGYVVEGLAAGATLPLLGLLRRLGESADSIIEIAGHQGGCAAKGLPGISAVDTSSTPV
jgi:hypothetical protein